MPFRMLTLTLRCRAADSHLYTLPTSAIMLLMVLHSNIRALISDMEVSREKSTRLASHIRHCYQFAFRSLDAGQCHTIIQSK